MGPSPARQLHACCTKGIRKNESQISHVIFVIFDIMLICELDSEVQMALSPRQRKILTLIETRQRVRVEDLSEKFATTPQTIRKDLQSLADLHHIVRFHGGAALIGGVEYAALSQRETDAQSEKRAIGAAVAARIPNNCAIFLNAGTTTGQVAHLLSGHSQLRVVTDNVDLASKIRAFPGLEVIVPGGVVRRSDGAILGAEAVDYIRQFRVDYAVIGAAAMAEDGSLLDFDLAEVQICRAMMDGARHVILALDGAKFGRSAPVMLSALERVNTVVTAGKIPPWVAALCADQEIDLAISSLDGP
jgi:DeoR family glycerol-3-phosphate regulon repressor